MHAAIREGQLAPDPAAAGLPGGCRVHSDLLIFTKSGKPWSSRELKASRRN
jgi:hypothetical protein